VLDAGQIAGIRSASAVLSQAEAVHRLASSTLRLALQQDFAQLLFDQADLNVLKTIADLRRKDAQMIALRYNSGRESKGDMLRSKAQLLQAEADYAQELRNLRTSRKALDRDLGLDDFTVVSATGSLAAKLPPPLPDNLTPYLDARPDVALQEAVVRGAEAGVEQSWSTAWPALSLTYSRSALGQKEFPSRQYGWSFLGVLSYPLFGGGPTSTYYAVSAAKRSLEKAREDLRGVRNQAVVGLESSWSSLMGAIDQVAVQTALLAAARQRNAEADIEYQGGLIDFNAWEIIASDRISQEKLAIQATLNAALAQAAWDNALGKELRD